MARAEATESGGTRRQSGGVKEGTSEITAEHEVIRKWIEDRDGTPCVVEGTESGGSGLLRVDFPGYRGRGRLKPISWEQFFRIFDDRNLGFLHQEETRDGEQSRFFKFVSRSAH